MLSAALTRPAAASHSIQGLGWAMFGAFATFSTLYLASELPREGGQIDAAKRRFETAKQQQERRGMA